MINNKLMSIRPFRDIKRKKTKKIKVGNVEIGGDSPISVQSMTNTLTTDIGESPPISTFPTLIFFVFLLLISRNGLMLIYFY